MVPAMENTYEYLKKEKGIFKKIKKKYLRYFKILRIETLILPFWKMSNCQPKVTNTNTSQKIKKRSFQVENIEIL